MTEPAGQVHGDRSVGSAAGWVITGDRNIVVSMDGHVRPGAADGSDAETGSARPRVYLSSTVSDLRECRAEIRVALQQMGLDEAIMGAYAEQEDRPLDRCLADLCSADLYIGVQAWRYGPIPDGQERSVTELEYEAAGEAGLTRLIFVLDAEAHWAPALMDLHAIGPVTEFRERLQREHSCVQFSSASDLRAKASEAVAVWLRSRSVSWQSPYPSAVGEWNAYAARLIQQYRRLDLEALTPPDRDENLQIALRDVFVEPDVREEIPTAELPKEIQRRLEVAAETDIPDLPRGLDRALLEQMRDSRRKGRARPAFEALTAPVTRTCVVLGDPGAGKSTLARYLVLALAEGRTEGPLQHLAGWRPILIELRDYAVNSAEYETFPAYLNYLKRTEELGLDERTIESYLRDDGRVLVLFDGLDEVFNPRLREVVCRRIAGFAARFPKARVIVTSRSVGYRQRVLTDAGFAHYSVQDLTPVKIDTFLQRWYELVLGDRPAVAASRRERLGQAITESAPIRELAGNPLLLTILAIIGKHQELPRERWKVYDHAAGVLVQHWDVNKHLFDQDIEALAMREDDKKDLLRRLAIRMQAGSHGSAGNNLTDSDLAAEIKGYLQDRFLYEPGAADRIADAMMRQLRERNFIFARYGPRVYGFVHRALLDFFAASEIVTRFEKSRSLSENELIGQVFGERKEDPAWTEVLRLIAGMVDATVAGRIVDSLLNSPGSYRSSALDRRPPAAVALAAQCIAEIRNVNAAAGPAERTLEAVIDLIRTPDRSFDGDGRLKLLEKSIVPSLKSVAGWPGRDRILDWFVAQGQFTIAAPAAKVAARLVSALFPEDQPVRDLMHANAYGSIPEQREAALHALHAAWENDDDTVRALADARYDPSPSVRRSSLELLLTRWPQRAETHIVLQHGLYDHDSTVRRAAIEGLAQCGEAFPEAFSTVARALRSDAAHNVRVAAASTIASTWPAEPEVTPLLNSACDDPAWQVRQSALRLLVSLPDPDDTVLALVHRGLRDFDEDVRRTALELLASRWTELDGTVTAVRLAARDVDASVRRLAVTTMALRWSDHPDTAAVLDLALRDPDGDVRVTALTIRSDPISAPEEFAALLGGVVTNDPTPGVRRAALQRMVADVPEICEPALRRAMTDPHHTVRLAAVTAVNSLAHRMPDVLPLAIRLCSDIDDGVRLEAVKVAARFGEDRSGVKELLARMARVEDRNLRRVAIESVAARWPDDPLTRSILSEGRLDADASIRHTAYSISLMIADSEARRAELLTQAWTEPHPEIRALAATLNLAMTCAVSNRNASEASPREATGAHRRALLESVLLASHGAHDSATLAGVLRQACTDLDGSVRLLAYSGLALRRDTIPGVVEDITAACRDMSWEIRAAALAQLLAAWPEHPLTVAERERGVISIHDVVRMIALESLFVDPTTASFQRAAIASRTNDWSIRGLGWSTLCRRHISDPGLPRHIAETLMHPQQTIRQAAADAVCASWPDTPVALRALSGLAGDQQTFVRITALQNLAVAWPSHRVPAQTAFADLDASVARVAWDLSRPGRWPELRAGLPCDPSRTPDSLYRLLALEKSVLEDPTSASAHDLIIRGLTDSDPVVRQTAHRALTVAELDPAAHQAILTKAALHPNSDVRSAAIEARARLLDASEDDYQFFVNAFADTDATVRLAAFTALIELAPHRPEAFTIASQAVADPSYPVRVAALRLVVTYWGGGRRTVPILERTCCDPDEDVRRASLEGLVLLQPSSAATTVAVRAAHTDPNVTVHYFLQDLEKKLQVDEQKISSQRSPTAPESRISRIFELRRLCNTSTNDAKAREFVLVTLNHADWLTRRVGLDALTWLWPDAPETDELLSSALSDEEALIRHVAYARIVQRNPGSDTTLEILGDALNDPSEWIRRGAISWLALWTAHERVHELLISASRDPDSWAVVLATKALAARWPDADTTHAAVSRCGCSVFDIGQEILTRLASTDASLKYLTKDGLAALAVSGSDRATVVLANQWADNPAIAHLLRRLWDQKDHATRAAILQVMVQRQQDDPQARRLIDKALSDPCSGVRSIAFESLWASKQFSKDKIQLALQDDEREIRYTALIAKAISQKWSLTPADGIAAMAHATTPYEGYDIFSFVAPQATAANWSKSEILEAWDAASMVNSFQRSWLDWYLERA
ncbi:HEAT repeat domain-containing protein [Actinoplanes oblitus]|uniref:HEAT repeat domain-containing protein n=1 Tax=Actinoplanes oblitus TaxID=3040509 RepID=A0ABY8W9L5_9ACTN|nr:HEAT repeat domain-containing protein [Actinoplanes oblitus]WIM94536.1 HEAT repeat domain-containing protein [Actinoplanes oblitus]